MPIIWRISYHATNSSHVTDHFLSTLLSLHYMCCVACCWKSRRPSPCRDRMPPAAPCVRARMLAHFLVSMYIAVVCSYGEALADRIVSYHDISSDIVSYLSFSLMAVSCHHYCQQKLLQCQKPFNIVHIFWYVAGDVGSGVGCGWAAEWRIRLEGSG